MQKKRVWNRLNEILLKNVRAGPLNSIKFSFFFLPYCTTTRRVRFIVIFNVTLEGRLVSKLVILHDRFGLPRPRSQKLTQRNSTSFYCGIGGPKPVATRTTWQSRYTGTTILFAIIGSRAHAVIRDNRVPGFHTPRSVFLVPPTHLDHWPE